MTTSGLLRKALDTFFTKLGDDRQLRARGLEKLQQELLSEGRQFYLRLPHQEGADPRVLAERAWIDLRLAKITDELGNFSDAIALSERARSSFEALAKKEPAVLEYREGVARSLDLLGSHYLGQHQPAEANESFAKAIAAWEVLDREHPSAPQFRRSLVVSLNRLGRLFCLVLQDPPKARSVLTRSVAFCEQALRDEPQSSELLSAQAEASLFMGYSWAEADFATARPFLDKALELREGLAGEDPDSFERETDLLDTCVVIASACSNARVPGSVPSLYKKVREIGERLAEEHRDVPKFAENRCLIETLYSIHLARSGEHGRAVASAEKALARSPRSGLALLFSACCCSVASDAASRDPSLKDTDKAACVKNYQDQAIALLREASKTGIFHQPHQFLGLKSDDPDMAPLRGLKEFQSLIAELESAGPPRSGMGAGLTRK
jgi:tetratricopeptide (TPR) repeat protein